MPARTMGVETAVPFDLARLTAFMGAALALAALATLLRRLARRASGPAPARSPSRDRIPVASWRGAAALVTAVAVGILLTPTLVVLRQLYALPGIGAPMAALLLMLLVLVAAAVLAVLFADPGEDR